MDACFRGPRARLFSCKAGRAPDSEAVFVMMASAAGKYATRPQSARVLGAGHEQLEGFEGSLSAAQVRTIAKVKRLSAAGVTSVYKGRPSAFMSPLRRGQ